MTETRLKNISSLYELLVKENKDNMVTTTQLRQLLSNSVIVKNKISSKKKEDKLSDELLNLVKLEENDKTKNVEENLARTINYMSNVLYNQLRNEKTKIKESKLNEFSTYIQAEKILLDNIDELRENMYTYTYKIKRKLREFKE